MIGTPSIVRRTGAGIGVLRVREDVRDLDRLSLDAGAACRRRPVEGMRMLLVIAGAFRLAMVGAQM
jgi:hypothetical protein